MIDIGQFVFSESIIFYYTLIFLDALFLKNSEIL